VTWSCCERDEVRNDNAIIWVSIFIVVASLATLYFFEFELQDIIIAVLAFVLITKIGRGMTKDADRSWMGWVIPLAFMVKLIGATFRHYTVTVVYNSGDALTYYGFAENAIHAWRSLELPISEGRSQGTRFIEVLTSLVFAPYFPTILGGFIMFATIAFMGQMLFYATFRRAMPHRRLKAYGLSMFFLPSLFFWPSSIGKESVLMFFIGLTVYGATLMYEGKWLASMPLVAAGMILTAAVRPHVAALLAGALVLSLIFGRMPKIRGGTVARFLLIAVAMASLFAAASAVTARFGVGLNAEEVQEFTDQVEGQTEQGGSSFDAETVTSPTQLPAATLRVLFRPLIHEAHNLQAQLSSVESTILLAMTLIALPRIVRNIRMVRMYPYLAFSLFFTGGFVIAFSSIGNAGILSRQRVQVIPFFLVLFFGLTVNRRALVEDGETGLERQEPEPPKPPILVGPYR